MNEIKPYLEHIELTLPDCLVTPFSRFRLLLKASGIDLPSNGSWFQIILTKDKTEGATETQTTTAISTLESKTTVVSQPQGEKLSVGTTGEWYLELQAPMEDGEYWLRVVTNAVDTEHAHVGIPLTVKHSSRNILQKTTPKYAPLFFASLGFLLSLLYLSISFEIEPFYRLWTRYVNAAQVNSAEIVSIPNHASDATIVQAQTKTSETNQILHEQEWTSHQQDLENLKVNSPIDDLLEHSFSHLNVSMRQKAWEALSRYVDSRENLDPEVIQKISRQRESYKKQTESWLVSKENPGELFKRLKLLTSVDDDATVQLWFGKYYATRGFATSDLGKAWQWFQRAAKKGNAEAQQLLSELEARADQMLKSTAVSQRKRGYEITEAVANAGGVNAQLWMGYRYETGDGVTKNLNVAANWYLKATSQGNEYARKKLSTLLNLIAQQKKK